MPVVQQLDQRSFRSRYFSLCFTHVTRKDIPGASNPIVFLRKCYVRRDEVERAHAFLSSNSSAFPNIKTGGAMTAASIALSYFSKPKTWMFDDIKYA